VAASAPSRAPASKRAKQYTVVLDPGHGGDDPGARGVSGDLEKSLTLTIVEEIAERLADQSNVRVVLTRSEDVTVPLAQRTAAANAQGADLFLSVHANASDNPLTAGIETYTLNNTNDRATIRLAALENGLTLAGAAEGEADLAYILSDLLQTGKEDESQALAEAVQSSLVSYLRGRWRSVHDLGVKRGPFYVLVGAYMPCVLIEVGFLTNDVEGNRIAAARYQRDLAEGIASGIRKFLQAQDETTNL
jgi:N-acetylmuramoyl-L-alanine amidase